MHAILVTNVIIWILLPSPTNFDLQNCLNVVIETQVALLRSVLQSAVRVPVPEGKRWTQHLMFCDDLAVWWHVSWWWDVFIGQM